MCIAIPKLVSFDNAPPSWAAVALVIVAPVNWFRYSVRCSDTRCGQRLTTV